MVELQILSKIIKDKSISLLTLNNITDDYFVTYSEEYNFIKAHLEQYGNVPDKETFQSKFPDFQIVEVSETDKYLVDTFNEEHLYGIAVPVVQKIADLMQTDSREAIEYLHTKLDSLKVKSAVMGTDIISQARIRYEQWEERRNNPEKFTISTGFHELDNILGGWQRGEELVVVFARTGQGKTWITMQTLRHAWKCGYRVGLIEPEMSDSKTGYRFDTLNSHLSNKAMMRGFDLPEYQDYIHELEQHSNPFFVVSPKEFNRNITVSKLKSFVATNNIEVLGIDGISYLTDERRQRGDNRTTQLTNISEDLMDLSIEFGIPVIVVAQSNREGAKDDEAPGLENIRDSDGIAFNASIALSVKQKDSRVELNLRKNRNGEKGSKLSYMWDIDTGKFTYVENDEHTDTTISSSEMRTPEYTDGSEVF